MALAAIAEAAAKNARIGARALREIFNGLIAPHEYDPYHSPKFAQTDKGPTLTIDQETVTAYLGRMTRCEVGSRLRPCISITSSTAIGEIRRITALMRATSSFGENGLVM